MLCGQNNDEEVTIKPFSETGSILKLRHSHIMDNISHREKEMGKVIVAKSAGPGVYTECAGQRVTRDGRCVTGYSHLCRTNVFRRSQSRCCVEAGLI